MFYLAIMLLLAHLLVDFYIQSENQVKDKSGSNGIVKQIEAHLIHSIEHFIGFFIALYVWFKIMGGDLCLFVIPSACVGLAYMIIHLLVDALKEYLKSKVPGKEFYLFVADQVIHFITIILCVTVISKLNIFTFTPIKHEHIKGITDILIILCGLLIILRPVSFLVEKFLSMAMAETKITHIRVTKSHLSKAFEDLLKKKLDKLFSEGEICDPTTANKALNDYKNKAEVIVKAFPSIDVSIDTAGAFASNKGGQWIGYVERVMIFTFFMFGQFTAIAAMMAIKTAFRFNDLKDDNDSHRSEYIMLGTFVSLFTTFLIALITKHFISATDLAKFIDETIKPFM